MNYKIEKFSKNGWTVLSIAMPRKEADKRVHALIRRNAGERYRLVKA